MCWWATQYIRIGRMHILVFRWFLHIPYGCMRWGFASFRRWGWYCGHSGSQWDVMCIRCYCYRWYICNVVIWIGRVCPNIALHLVASKLTSWWCVLCRSRHFQFLAGFVYLFIYFCCWWYSIQNVEVFVIYGGMLLTCLPVFKLIWNSKLLWYNRGNLRCLGGSGQGIWVRRFYVSVLVLLQQVSALFRSVFVLRRWSAGNIISTHILILVECSYIVFRDFTVALIAMVIIILKRFYWINCDWYITSLLTYNIV